MMNNTRKFYEIVVFGSEFAFCIDGAEDHSILSLEDLKVLRDDLTEIINLA